MPSALLRQLVLLLLLAASVTGAHAAEFVIRDTSVSIPVPEGYVHLTDEMPISLAAFTRIQPINQRLVAAFVPADHLREGGGAFSGVTRSYVCAYPTQLLRMDSSGLDFTMYKISLKSTNRMQVHDAHEARQAWLQGAVPEGVARLKVPLDIHHETDSTISFSVLTGEPDHTGEIRAGQATTVTAVHVAQRILLLEATGPVSDLEWTRDASADWALAVLEANPRAPEESSATAVLVSIGLVLLVLVTVGGTALYLDKRTKLEATPKP